MHAACGAQRGYPSPTIPAPYRGLAWLNPMTGVVEGFRRAILGAGDVDAVSLLWSVAAALAVFFLGAVFFVRAQAAGNGRAWAGKSDATLHAPVRPEKIPPHAPADLTTPVLRPIGLSVTSSWHVYSVRSLNANRNGKPVVRPGRKAMGPW